MALILRLLLLLDHPPSSLLAYFSFSLGASHNRGADLPRIVFEFNAQPKPYRLIIYLPQIPPDHPPPSGPFRTPTTSPTSRHTVREVYWFLTGLPSSPSVVLVLMQMYGEINV